MSERPNDSGGGSGEMTGLLDGTWERAGRSPGAAALVILLAIGILYFNVQSILGIFVVLAFEPAGAGNASL